jgi:hypothetical protein
MAVTEKDTTVPQDEAKEKQSLKNKNRKKSQDLSNIIQSHTLRFAQWTYFHLRLFSLSANPVEHDILTAKQRISAALVRFLGVLGSSIQVDILHLDNNDLWVRVPRECGNAFHEAMSSWSEADTIKYVVKGRDDWLVKLLPNKAEDLF